MYKATKNINTEFSDFKKGDIVSDAVGERYAGFEKIEEVEAPKVAKTTPKKKEKKKEEILTEVSAPVEVEITEE